MKVQIARHDRNGGDCFLVTYAKVEEAYIRWCEICGINQYSSFWKFIGTGGNYQLYLTASERRRLELLLGHHYVAITKIYKARGSVDED